MGSIPTLATNATRLVQIPGSMPRLTAIPKGCAFNPRCTAVVDRCRRDRPDPMSIGPSRVACWLVDAANAEVTS